MNLMDYYMTADLYEPPMFQNREFAIIKDGRMWRHLAFENLDKLRGFLIAHQPKHVYFSTAKYKDPGNQDMIIKRQGWLGSDLIFDIDNDHLANPTLGEAAYNLLQLKEVLENKFAVNDILYTFSGSRGYHAHVRDERIQKLNNHERQQIVEYVESLGICIDAPVTADTARLIRLPGSIHGKTGKACSIMEMI